MFDFLKCGSGEGGRAHPLGRESARSTSTYSTVQTGKVQSKTVCYCKAQGIIVQYTTEQYGTVHCSTVQVVLAPWGKYQPYPQVSTYSTVQSRAEAKTGPEKRNGIGNPK